MALRSAAAALLALFSAGVLADSHLDDVPLVQHGVRDVGLDSDSLTRGAPDVLGTKLYSLPVGADEDETGEEGLEQVGEGPERTPAGELNGGKVPDEELGAELVTEELLSEADAACKCTEAERKKVRYMDDKVSKEPTEKGRAKYAPSSCMGHGELTYDNSGPCLQDFYGISPKCAECQRMLYGHKFQDCKIRCVPQQNFCPSKSDAPRSDKCFTAMGACQKCQNPALKQHLKCQGGMKNRTRVFTMMDNFAAQCNAGTMTNRKYGTYRAQLRRELGFPARGDAPKP